MLLEVLLAFIEICKILEALLAVDSSCLLLRWSTEMVLVIWPVVAT